MYGFDIIIKISVLTLNRLDKDNDYCLELIKNLNLIDNKSGFT